MTELANNHCNQQQFEQLLAESLPARDENQISDHLAVCLDCRSDFETFAAARDWWSDATGRLSRIAARKQADSRNLSDCDNDDDLGHFSTDFAVDFLEPSDDHSALGRLGEYEILEVIGRGGMGIVLKGFQKELHRYVAVKVLSPHLATSGAARRRFAREAQATAAVVHPHVMAIHSVNATAKLPYLIMQLIDCESLQQRLDRHGPLDPKDILRIGMQAALGLAAAHAQGLVHRDVKPANILLETNVDRLLLTDFGLARAVDDATLTRTGVIAGTPQYMSPEQANGDQIDHRSDLFSLGGVLYAMCTARPPFRADTTFGVLRRIRETAPRSILEINPDIPAWLERLVMKLLERDTERRFQSAQEVATLCEQCLGHLQQPKSIALPAAVDEPELKTESQYISPQHSRVKQYALLSLIVLMAGLVTTALFFTLHPHRGSDLATGSADAVRSEVEEEPHSNQPAEALQRHDELLPSDWDRITSELDDTESTLEQIERSVESTNEANNPF